MQGVRDQTTLFGTALLTASSPMRGMKPSTAILATTPTRSVPALARYDPGRTLTLGGGGYDTVDMSTLSRSSIRMNVDGSDLVLSLVNSLGSRTASVSISSQYGGNMNDVIELLKFSGGQHGAHRRPHRARGA